MNGSFESRMLTIFTIGGIYCCGRLAEVFMRDGDPGAALGLTLVAGICGFAMLDPAS